MTIKNIEDFEFKGKKVLLRADFNVPIEDGHITDDTRILGVLPTIKFIMERGARLIMTSHLGRPKGKTVPELTLKPVSEKLSTLLAREVKFSTLGIGSDDLKTLVNSLNEGELLLLENIRFYSQEKECDENFSRDLALLVDIYINDAFGTSHRKHASTYGVAKYITNKGMGYLMQKELKYLKGAVESPDRPFVAIMGGAKVSDKIELIKNIAEKVDRLLIGGGMCFTFLKCRGYQIGKSLYEPEKLELAGQILDQYGDRILLPEDILVTTDIETAENLEQKSVKNISPDDIGVDIGKNAIEVFSGVINNARTVLFNGPMGIFENEKYASGTREVLNAMSDISGLKIIGGGDSVASVRKFNLSEKMTHISTGGGASLELLAGKELPGFSALKTNQ